MGDQGWISTSLECCGHVFGGSSVKDSLSGLTPRLLYGGVGNQGDAMSMQSTPWVSGWEGPMPLLH